MRSKVFEDLRGNNQETDIVSFKLETKVTALKNEKQKNGNILFYQYARVQYNFHSATMLQRLLQDTVQKNLENTKRQVTFHSM